MKIKYSPCKWNEYAKIDARPDTDIEVVDANSIKIDGELYEFDTESIQFPDIYTQTDGKILNAYRDESNILYITVRRFYTYDCTEWDDGEYNEIKG